MRAVVIFFSLILLAGILPAQRDFSKVKIKVTHVNGNVYMLEGAGGNIGASVGADGILIVDDQFAPLADKIRAALDSIGSGPLKFILNTHWHGDHTGGNEVFGPEAPIIAHTNVRKRLSTGIASEERTISPAPEDAWPVITFDASLSVHFNDEEIKVIHFPEGHTDGDAVIFFTGSNVVHMGDLFFSGRFPFVDIASGGNAIMLSRNVEQVLNQIDPEVMIIPGHGPLSTYKDLQRYHQMLKETIAIVRKGRDAGKSLNELKTAGLPEKWSGWSWGFINTEKWIEAIYRSLNPK